MKVDFNKEDNMLVIILAHQKIDHAYETEGGLMHVAKNNEPVMLEIFDAKRFLAEEAKTLPNDVKQHFFAV